MANYKVLFILPGLYNSAWFQRWTSRLSTLFPAFSCISETMLDWKVCLNPGWESPRQFNKHAVTSPTLQAQNRCTRLRANQCVRRQWADSCGSHSAPIPLDFSTFNGSDFSFRIPAILYTPGESPFAWMRRVRRCRSHVDNQGHFQCTESSFERFWPYLSLLRWYNIARSLPAGAGRIFIWIWTHCHSVRIVSLRWTFISVLLGPISSNDKGVCECLQICNDLFTSEIGDWSGSLSTLANTRNVRKLLPSFQTAFELSRNWALSQTNSISLRTKGCFWLINIASQVHFGWKSRIN